MRRVMKDRPLDPVKVECIVKRDNILSAWKQVRANKGACGVDGITIEEFPEYAHENWKGIKASLLAGEYTPSPVKRVEIPKDSGGTRPLGIPTVMDRVIQQAVCQVLTPVFDPHFSESSFGFRPNRSGHQAVKRVLKDIKRGYRYAVDIDLEKFFDTVDHDTLMNRVARKVRDKDVLKLIGKYLRAGVVVNGRLNQTSKGAPQGGPLFPLLYNILLDDLDKEREARGHWFCRYAEDCKVYVKSKGAGEREKRSITRFLAKPLRLKENEGKSAVDRPCNRSLLGYTMTAHREPKVKVSPKARERVKRRVWEIMRRGRGRKLVNVRGELTLFWRGWMNYFRLSQVKAAFEELDGWIRRKQRCIVWVQWKRPKTRAKMLIKLGIDKARAIVSANNGRGKWWNAGASHMHSAVPAEWLSRQGLISLLDDCTESILRETIRREHCYPRLPCRDTMILALWCRYRKRMHNR